MTDSPQNPTPDAGSEPRPNGAAGDSRPSEPGHDASSSGGAGQATERDYIARLKGDPDFAASEVRKHQSAATKAANEARTLRTKLGSLSEVLDQGISGDIVAKAISEYQVLANDPTIARALQQYRQTGQLQLTPQQQRAADGGESDPLTDDDYLSDTERALAKRLDDLDARNRQLESQLSETSRNFGVQSLEQHLSKAFTEYGITDGEIADRVRESMLSQVSQWQSQGEPGSRALRDLQDPTRGYDTVQLMVAKSLGPKGLLELAEERVRRTGSTRAELATDGPSMFGTQGNEPPPEHDNIMDAIRTAKARPEVLKRYG